MIKSDMSRATNTEEGPHPLGSCNSYAPAGCDENFGYGSSDIFFLEVCIYNTICKNGADVFKLDVGEAFHCELHREGFVKLKNWPRTYTGRSRLGRAMTSTSIYVLRTQLRTVEVRCT